MAKYVVPFVDETKWETHTSCRYCNSIDKRYKGIIELQKDSKNLDRCQELINEVNQFTVDGYGLVQTYESDGMILTDYDKIKQVGTYKNYTADVIQKSQNYIAGRSLSLDVKNISDVDDATVFFGRWCAVCGARKPDVYDTLRLERLDLLPISSFRIENKGATAEIVWKDSESTEFSYSKLFRNNEEIAMCAVKDKYYDNEKYVDTIEPGILYQYYIVNYDSYNKPIATSTVKMTLTESEDKQPPGVCTNVTALQTTKLYKKNDTDNTYETKNILYFDYTNPTDADFLATEVRIGLETYLPDTERAGKHAEKEMLFEEYGLELNKLYWIKPFPHDRGKWKHVNDGYEMFYNYNRDSDFAVIELTEPCKEITSISIVNGNKEAKVSWTDPVENWAESYVGIREATDTPITDIKDCKIVYKTDEPVSNKSYVIPGLDNGRKYQVAIFTVSKKGVVTVCHQQIVAEPIYKQDSETFGDKCRLTYMDYFQYTSEIISGKNIIKDCFWTHRHSVAWLDCKHALQEGATIDMDVMLDGHTVFTLYSNQDKIFRVEGPLNWKHISVDIAPVDFCRIVFDASSEYDVMGVYLKNISLSYNTNSLSLKDKENGQSTENNQPTN
jgi:hypothetical protein